MTTDLKPQSIPDQPFPQDISSTTYPSATTGQSVTQLSPEALPERSFPSQVIAVHTIGDSIDTQSKRIKGTFKLDKSGGIQVGEYQDGVSGEVDITSNGIVAKNKNNQETLTIDGDTGEATFMGTIQAGSLVGGDGNVIIDKDPDTGGGREVISDGTNDIILIGYQKGGF